MQPRSFPLTYNMPYKTTAEELLASLPDKPINKQIKKCKKTKFVEIGASYDGKNDATSLARGDLLEREVRLNSIPYLDVDPTQKERLSRSLSDDEIFAMIAKSLNITTEKAKHVCLACTQGTMALVINILMAGIIQNNPDDPMNERYSLRPPTTTKNNIFHNDGDENIFFSCYATDYAILDSQTDDPLNRNLPLSGQTHALYKLACNEKKEWGFKLIHIETDNTVFLEMIKGWQFTCADIIKTFSTKNLVYYKANQLCIEGKDQDPCLTLVTKTIASLTDAITTSGLTSEALNNEIDCVASAFHNPSPDNLVSLYQQILSHHKACKTRVTGGVSSLLIGAGLGIAAIIGGASTFGLGLFVVIGTGGMTLFASGTGLAADALRKRGELVNCEQMLLTDKLHSLLTNDHYAKYAIAFLKIIAIDAKERGTNSVRDNHIATCINSISQIVNDTPLIAADLLSCASFLKNNSPTSTAAGEVMVLIEQIEKQYLNACNHTLDEEIKYHAYIIFKLRDITANASQRGINIQRDSELDRLVKMTNLSQLNDEIKKAILTLRKATYISSTTADELEKISKNIEQFQVQKTTNQVFVYEL